jgi:branched-subunit amino acid aminotransferase/4-amino-4-deoxychorismate lyase
VSAREEPITLERLAGADALLLTSSVRLVSVGTLAGGPSGEAPVIAERLRGLLADA